MGRLGFCGRHIFLEDIDCAGRRGFFWKTWIFLEGLDSMEDWICWKTSRLLDDMDCLEDMHFLEVQDCLEDLDIVGRLAVAGRTGDAGRP